jgi:hypothetical protein
LGHRDATRPLKADVTFAINHVFGALTLFTANLQQAKVINLQEIGNI